MMITSILLVIFSFVLALSIASLHERLDKIFMIQQLIINHMQEKMEKNNEICLPEVSCQLRTEDKP